MDGYAGSILSVDLSQRRITALHTAAYEGWVGGHGMGSALFFERVKDKTIDGFHPDNLLTLVSSPNAAGQGGVGAVFGSKGLKAVSVLGTGGIKVHDPRALLASRMWLKNNHSFDLTDLKLRHFSFVFQSPPSPMTLYARGRPRAAHRPQACLGCTLGSVCIGRDALTSNKNPTQS